MTDLFNNQANIKDKIKELCALISAITDVDEKIDALNYVRAELHKVSPLKHHPVDFVAWEKSEKIEGNDYNPNSVAPPEMALLITSIEEDGYTMPIVGNPEEDIIRIVDGFHRRQSERKSKKISASTFGRLPVSFIREDHRELDSRMASTIRHNRARGSHDIDLMSNIVKELILLGRKETWIKKHIGMDTDEILRLKQLTGIASLFIDNEFSQAWEVENG
ncbi:MAG: ParB N-terminal domain-containing protein [Prevotellaceae bacterium]|jgi:ParB-like chromosome segregation protein Spo0J|nr:ParB N-terminal domain-containing protein [Prevotellaceae bacterium]